MRGGGTDEARWLFLTSHAHVLLQVARDPAATVRAIAERVGVTERQAHRVLADLVEAGYVTRARVGRRNNYRIDSTLKLRHPELAQHEIGELIELLRPESAGAQARVARRSDAPSSATTASGSNHQPPSSVRASSAAIPRAATMPAATRQSSPTTKS